MSPTGESATTTTIAEDAAGPSGTRDSDFPSSPRSSLPALKLGDLAKDLACPVCFQRLRDPFLTACGHSFCYSCISMHLSERSSCPCCSSYLTANLTFPNVLLGKVAREVQAFESMKTASLAEHLKIILQHGAHDMSLKEIDFLLKVLTDMKSKSQQKEAEENMDSLLEFFHELKHRKVLELERIKDDIKTLKNDAQFLRQERKRLRASMKLHLGKFAETGRPAPANSGSSGISQTSNLKLLQPTAKRKRNLVLTEQYDVFRQCYIDGTQRCKEQDPSSGLGTFRSIVSGFSRYRKLHVLSETCSEVSPESSSNIISGLDFDPDDEFFVTGGVSGYLRVYEFPKVVKWSLAQWNPTIEIQTGTKLSCVSWDKFSKSCIATSDYDGIIKLWDTTACQNTDNYDEHERRTWSVEFSPVEPSRLISGGDDGKVKLWSKEQKTSVHTVEVKANICSVTFNPSSSDRIAAGAADQCVYYYDLRHSRSPLHIFKGHEKAVSYVKFVSSSEMVSASTDGTLRLWSLDQNWSALQVFRGHRNEKNFVGLSVSSEYIACGSETNEIYVYHKGVPKPAVSHLFTSKDLDNDSAPFISAVCWKKSESTTMLAASSQGSIRALMLAS